MRKTIDLVIYSTRYVYSKSIKMLNLYYHELMGKIEEHERKKYLMVDDYMLDKVLRINNTHWKILRYLNINWHRW